MDLIEKIENEIYQQTRNGRDTIYIEVEDLRELGIYIDEKKQGREFVDLKILQPALKRYKFRNSLKVDINNCSKDNITYREFIREIKNIEKGRDD
jgi:biotin operon repressor